MHHLDAKERMELIVGGIIGLVAMAVIGYFWISWTVERDRRHFAAYACAQEICGETHPGWVDCMQRETYECLVEIEAAEDAAEKAKRN